MRLKSKLEKIFNDLIGKREVIIAHESLEHRGSFKIIHHDELGLLSHEAVKAHFNDQEFEVIFLIYEDDWRGGGNAHNR